MPVGDVALVATVSTDSASVVFGDVGASAGSTDVRPALGTGGVLKISLNRLSYSILCPSLSDVVSVRAPWVFQNSRTRARRSRSGLE
jgi:hypothetical protein